LQPKQRTIHQPPGAKDRLAAIQSSRRQTHALAANRQAGLALSIQMTARKKFALAAAGEKNI